MTNHAPSTNATLENLRSLRDLVAIVVIDALGFFALAAVTRALVYGVERLYGPEVPRNLTVVESFSGWFFAAGFLFQLAIHLYKHFRAELGLSDALPEPPEEWRT
jgi:hypothetical protein